MFRYRKANGQPLAINGQRVTLFTLELFFRWLVKHGVLPSNPAADLELPRRTDDLREPLTLEEMEAVLALPDIATPEGLRDRACLELFYATGIRRAACTKAISTPRAAPCMCGWARARRTASCRWASGRWRGWISISRKRGRCCSRTAKPTNAICS